MAHHARSIFALALLLVGGCTASPTPPFEGTFTGIAVTPLPSPPLPMADLTIDATLRLRASDSSFELDMDLEAAGLTDVMNVRGTYVAANGMLSLEPTGYEADETDTWTCVEGNCCIVLDGFVGTEVCVAEQTNDYAEVGGELGFTLEPRIAGVDGSVDFVLTRVTPEAP